MKYPERYRAPHPGGYPHKKGDQYGWFEVERIGKTKLCIMASPPDGEWQHVSVSTRHRCPDWQEMCFVKSLFWDDEECVVQFHPPKSEYVNNHDFCLHLWKYNGQMPMPDKGLV